jgi:N-acetylneuraminic acid mutarotase
MPEPRCTFAACAVGSDIYVFGGAESTVRGSIVQASVFKYDTEANVWSTLTPMPHACRWHSASLLGGLVYIVGAGVNHCEILCFDPASGFFSTLTPSSCSRELGTSFVLDGCLYAAGGSGQWSSVERYDVASNTWTAMTDMLEGRRMFGAVATESSGPVEEQDLFDSLIAKAFI